jgi:REP element-mobilizing transposase RayT
MEEANYKIHACSILPQHLHLVIGRHQRDIRRIVGHLKARATQQLLRDGLHPLAKHCASDGGVPSPWGRKGWAVYIFSEQHMRKSIQYVVDNPLKEGKRRQSWSFVLPYDPDHTTRPARGKPRR